MADTFTILISVRPTAETKLSNAAIRSLAVNAAIAAVSTRPSVAAVSYVALPDDVRPGS